MIELKQVAGVPSPRVLLLLRSPFGLPAQQQRQRYPCRPFHLIQARRLFSAWGQAKGEFHMCSGKVLLLMLFGMVLVLSVGAAQPQLQESAPRRLLSNAATTRKKAQNELLAARSNLVSGLIAIVKDKKNQLTRPRQDSVARAMFILGEMRAPEAVEILVSNIAFPDTLPQGAERTPRIVVVHGSTLRSRPLRTMPAVQALAKIGEPCIEATINKLATTYNVAEQDACFRVLIELREPGLASAMLKRAVARETDPKKRERLQNGVDRLDLLLKIK